MRVVVVNPAEPIIEPSDVPGDRDDDAQVEQLILAAQNSLAGPRGWLGCSLGEQTLEAALGGWWRGAWRLPCPPVIDVVGLSYRDAAGGWVAVADADFVLDGDELWLRPGFAVPAVGAFPYPVRVQYRAGYDTSEVPPEAKQAVILLVQDMLRTGSATPGLRSETVEGVGSRSFMDSDRLTVITKSAVDSLLSGLRVYSL